MSLPEIKLITDFVIEDSEKEKWRPVNNHNIKNYTEDEIKRITDNYSTTIGKGGFGQVYKGALNDGTPVAVKKYFFPNLKEGFAKEITVHCQINHNNVVRLLGYCAEENALMIVTEYVPRGNLSDLLHGSDNPIPLDDRLRIAIECADALRYMHCGMYQPIIHGDIKPDNILLDSELSAKLSDFGLSRLRSMGQIQYTMNVAGSIGYMDPGYIDTGLLDPKIDVYSFGVVLLELITGAKASENGLNTGLRVRFIDALSQGKQGAMFDPKIASKENMTFLDDIGNLAAECFTKGIKERPGMEEVEERLKTIRSDLRFGRVKKKDGQGSSWGMHDRTEKVDKHDKNVSSSSWGSQDTMQKFKKYGTSISSSSSSSVVPYKSNILDIFTWNARKKYFERNGGHILQSVSLRIFTKHELGKITRNYSTFVGKGSSGDVYKGWIDHNESVVVKKSILVDEAQTDKFIKALVSASRIKHLNIIRFLGCCLETEVPVLVYEFASGGNLQDILHGNGGRCPLSLSLRLDIAIRSAEALAYLHSSSNEVFVHGNFKSTKILLDENNTPKVSDICSAGISDLAYLDPVYLQTGQLTSKSDVYSFGIVLLELITRKQARYGNNRSLQSEFMSAYKYGDRGIGRDMLDIAIVVEQINMDTLQRMGDLAFMCLKLDPDERPPMREVVDRLHSLKAIWMKKF